MLIDSETMFSITQANQNFSAIAKTVESEGKAVILKNNKPKYVVMNFDSLEFELTDDEKIDIIAKRVLEKYLPAFKELAK